jgi:tRNA (guanine-N7-)-methyltransferase
MRSWAWQVIFTKGNKGFVMTSGTPPETPRSSHIRSFVRRGGRLTRAQNLALQNLWPRYGLDPDGPLDLQQAFGRDAPRVLEIGFGMGDALAAMAAAHPERDYLGIDVHEAGIGRLLHMADEAGLENLRVLRGDAVVVLRERLHGPALDAIMVFFPDPWPKKRHHKRRLIRPGVVALLADRIKTGGQLQLATDWQAYAEQMLEVIEANGRFRNLAGVGRFCEDAGERPVTRFQQRGERLGHGIFDLRFERMAAA